VCCPQTTGPAPHPCPLVTSGSAARPTVERARLADPAASPESHMNSRRDTGLGACMTYLLREQQSGSIGLGCRTIFFGIGGRIRQSPRKIDFRTISSYVFLQDFLLPDSGYL